MDLDVLYEIDVPGPGPGAHPHGRRTVEQLVFAACASGLAAAPPHAPYGAAKAAPTALVRSAAVEPGPRGVRVNAVAPGVVRTPRAAALPGAGGGGATRRPHRWAGWPRPRTSRPPCTSWPRRCPRT
ncbi:SDR family oxidoreductase [Streptomyces erythrochromogenes]|uniref:SDR family oxidoreductase n=1 Tax=Streptomyces erythrochromogenes TaxID=285574 RepID=UPI00338FF396